MAREVRHSAVTVPAGTTKAAPLVADVSFPVRVLRRIDYRLPSGCAGLVGFFIAMSKTQVFPLPAGTYIVGDTVSGGWDVADQPDSGAWQVIAYNLGTFQHTIHLDFHVDLTGGRDDLAADIDPLALSSYSAQAGAWYG